jgi:uncharacterized protein YcbX
MQPELLGRVVALFRYPVKSMAGESLEEVEVGWNGLIGDRRWAFVRGGLVRSGFPWLTIRESPRMWHYQPRFADETDPEKSMTLVRTPDGDDFEIVDPALAQQLGHDSHVIKQSRGIFDDMPLSLITTQTIASLEARVGTDLEPRRFRPNLVIESANGGDAPENEWIGEVLQIGEMQMRVDQRDKRCVMINVDPVTTEKNPLVLRTVAQEQDKCLGVYGTIVRPGLITVGSPVFAV